MPTFNNFAIIGSGSGPSSVGDAITKALVAKGVKLILLTRSESRKSTLEGVEAIQVSYTDVPALATVLKDHNIEVLISTVGYPGFVSQFAMVDAAKQAGVQLFLPSEFGMPTLGREQEENILGVKAKVAAYSNSQGLPYALIFTGFFMEWADWIVGFGKTGKINILGEGETPVSWTSIEDIGGFLGYILTELPRSSIEYKDFRIQGSKASLTEVAKKTHPGEKIEYFESFPEEISYLDFYHTAANAGFISTGWDVKAGREIPEYAGRDNSLRQGHVWKTF